MNYTTAVLLINDSVRLIGVSYELNSDGRPAQTHVFKTLDPAIKTGDFVIVPTDTRHKATVCRVEDDAVDVDNFIDSSTELKWIIGRLDKVTYDQCLAMEDEAIKVIKSAEKRRKREELRKSILADVADKELTALPIYKQAAE